MGVPEWSIEPLEMFDWAISSTAPQYNRHALRPDLDDIYHRPHQLDDELAFINIEKKIATGLELAEIFLAAAGIHVHGTAGLVLAGAGPVAYTLTAVGTAILVYKAFDVPLRIQNAKGITCGLMWEVMGLPDVERTTKPAPTESVEIPMTPGERQAWEDGVREGRELARDPKVQAEIKRALAVEMFLQQREADTDPHERAWEKAVDRTLDRIWSDVHEDLPPLEGSRLSWPGVDYGDPRRILATP